MNFVCFFFGEITSTDRITGNKAAVRDAFADRLQVMALPVSSHSLVPPYYCTSNSIHLVRLYLAL